jgi:hypothetical protein
VSSCFLVVVVLRSSCSCHVVTLSCDFLILDLDNVRLRVRMILLVRVMGRMWSCLAWFCLVLYCLVFVLSCLVFSFSFCIDLNLILCLKAPHLYSVDKVERPKSWPGCLVWPNPNPKPNPKP